MKFEHLFILKNKAIVFLIELTSIIYFFSKNLNFFFFKWQVSAFADYYWFLYSNKYFTFLNKHL